jgi:hypothetical protein
MIPVENTEIKKKEYTADADDYVFQYSIICSKPYHAVVISL